ncbi:MAG: TSCPD domain-containing protein, partial [Firmicutes bacterium]|nr:TSCPD domain-containing protein [Bacillota bacterium]
GNLQGITRLLLNRPAKEAADLLEGTRCGGKATSCPDQIAKAIRQCLAEQA